MMTQGHLDGPFETILATPPDLVAIAEELRDLSGTEWVTPEGRARLDVLLRATELVRDVGPRLVERVRLLERIADGGIRHAYRGSCPDPTTGPDTRDVDCRACQILGAA